MSFVFPAPSCSQKKEEGTRKTNDIGEIPFFLAYVVRKTGTLLPFRADPVRLAGPISPMSFENFAYVVRKTCTLLPFSSHCVQLFSWVGDLRPCQLLRDVGEASEAVGNLSVPSKWPRVAPRVSAPVRARGMWLEGASFRRSTSGTEPFPQTASPRCLYSPCRRGPLA